MFLKFLFFEQSGYKIIMKSILSEFKGKAIINVYILFFKKDKYERLF